MIELQVSNVKRVRAVRYAPDPRAPMVVVQGPNGAGKSSVIDAIAYAIGGAKLIPAEPLRTGEPAGYVSVDLGDVVVTRRWSRHPHSGAVSSKLEVRGRDGTRLQRAQESLDTLLGALSFDPLAFTREPARRQLELVQQLVGLDFSELDARRTSLYLDRTDRGRELRAADAEAARRRRHADVPDEPVSVEALVAELERATTAQSLAQSAQASAAQSLLLRTQTESAVGRARVELEAAQRRLQELERELALRGEELERAQASAGRLQGEAAALDPAPIRARLSDAERVNRLVRENVESAAAHARARKLHAEVESMTAAIDEIDLEKERRAAAAALPVPGLGFRFDGLLLDGVPFEQASQAQQIRVSVAMGAALNPTLRVLLVRDGSLLDDRSLALLRDVAAERELQVWVERVAEAGAGESTGDVLCIEDGEAVLAAA